jgi:hypothetical protein
LEDLDVQDDFNDDVDIQDDFVDDVNVQVESSSKGTSNEDDEDSEDLEEGEFVPPLNWNQVFRVPYGFAEDYVKPYLQDPGLVEREQREVERQEFLDAQMNVPDFAPRILSFKVFAKVGDFQEAFSKSWDIDDSTDFNVNEYPVPIRDEDHLHIIPEAERIIPAVDWRRQEILPHLYWDFIMDKDARSYSSVILSWFFEKELCLFVIKRKEGCQYLTPMQNQFHSLSESDLMELGRKWLVNPTNDRCAEFYSKKLNDDFKLRYREEGFDKTKLFVKPRKLKKITKADGSVEYVQRRIKCILKVPAKKWPQDVLGNLSKWEIEKNTGEARMYSDREKKVLILRMNDPMQLVNLSRNDQRRLYDTECGFINFWKTEEHRYRKILRICLHERIHADSRRLLFDGN